MNGASDNGLAWRPISGGLALSVRLIPKSSRDAVDGVQVMADGRAVIAARVRAVPEKGKANAALINLLAKWLGMPATSLSVTAGQTARLKTVLIEGEAGQLAEHLQSRIKAI